MRFKRMLSVNKQAIAETLAANPNVVAAWLFGSAQSGRTHPGSDIDIGALFDHKPDLDERIDLLTALQDALNFERVDLVVLNGASPILRFEAVSGTLLFERPGADNVERRVAFVSLTARQYEYSMALIERGLRWRREVIESKEKTAELDG